MKKKLIFKMMKSKNNFWKNKNVFVTGHTGFKGSWLCIYLNLLGANITGYSLKPKSNPNLFSLAKIDSFIKKSVLADVRDFKKLNSEIKKSKAKIIFHLAAQPLVRFSYLNPKETFETNINGTLNILECIRKNRTIKSSVIITTDKVYDISKNKIFKESDLLGGIDPYSASKVCCEYLFSSYIKSFFKSNKFQRLATVRAGNVIGGGDYSEDRLIPDILNSAKNNNKILLRNPSSIRPWQHVLEPILGYLILAEKNYKNQIKNVSQNWNFGPNLTSCKTVRYVAKKFSESLKVGIKTTSKKSKDKETDLLRLSNFKAKKLLQWSPKWSLDFSIKKIIEWNNVVKKGDARFICEKQIKEFLFK
jgi:CDP-glucose 4,6-dehydratase